MTGGAGGDRYNVDNAGDRAIETDAAGGTDSVESTVSFSLAGQYLESLTLTGSAAINATGNGLVNILTGNAAANVLDGGGGADTMTGGAGNDRYVVDHAGDRAVEASTSGGVDTVESAVAFSLAGQYLEHLTLTGSAAVSATGNGLANALTGNNAANKLYGAAGNDSLRGNGGADGFHFDSALNASTNVDRILDFSVADDTIFLDRAIFKGIAAGALSSAAFVNGSAATDAADRILYDKASGNIFYDSDGSGGAAAVLFAQVNAGTALTHLDFNAYLG
jgi:Ca2+-binding RTX toxin-like protein